MLRAVARRASRPRAGGGRALASAFSAALLLVSLSLAPGQGTAFAAARDAAARGDAPDSLYESLAAAPDAREARRIETAIVRTWLRSGSPTADLLAGRAHVAVGLDELPLAIELLDRAIALAPDWPEAYARRGQIFAALGDDERAAADFNQVLAYNERHFVVLATLAGVLDRAGVRKGALQLYDRALAINPHMDSARAARDRLRVLVEGRPL